MFAAMNDNYDGCKLLLLHKANPNLRDYHGNTPMHQAVRNNNLEIVKLLDKFYGDAKIRNISKVSAIDLIIDDRKEFRENTK